MKAESGGVKVESAINANGLVRPKSQQQIKGCIEEKQRMDKEEEKQRLEREDGPSEGERGVEERALSRKESEERRDAEFLCGECGVEDVQDENDEGEEGRIAKGLKKSDKSN